MFLVHKKNAPIWNFLRHQGFKCAHMSTIALTIRHTDSYFQFFDFTKKNFSICNIYIFSFDKFFSKGKLIDVIIENDKLREVADVARNQIEVLEHKKSMENTELEALRHEIIDLQSQSDEKSLVGKLHRQIVSFQLKENDNANKIKQLENKLSHSEAHSLRIQQRADEKEAMVVQIRTQSYIKCKSLFKIIQDLRRQYR